MALYFWLFITAFAHSYYVSITQIEYNNYTQSIEVSCKIFTDDFEAALEKTSHEKMHLGTDHENPNANQLIRQYLTDNLVLEINGKPVVYDFSGKEVSADATWCYLEIRGVKELNSLKITNSLLTETYETQANIVHVTSGKDKRSIMLNKNKTSDLLNFTAR